ncbi:class I SAM-dependent methyltransferase [Thermomonas brevis]
MERADELAIQESQYCFPYHHVVGEIGGVPSRAVVLKWGFEYRAYVEHLLGMVSESGCKTILEVGCGDGYLGAAMLKAGYMYTGVDISDRAIGFAKAFSDKGAYVCGRAECLDKNYDLVLLCEVLEHIEEPTSFLIDVARKVRRGGVLLVSVPSIVRPTHPKHFRHYSEESLVDEIKKVPGARVAGVQHFFVDNKLYRLYLSLLFNRYWSIDLKIISALEWAVVKKFFARDVRGKGAHLVVKVYID